MIRMNDMLSFERSNGNLQAIRNIWVFGRIYLKLCLTLFLTLAQSSIVHAQYMVVELINEPEQTFQLSEIRKVTFSSGVQSFHMVNDDVASIGMDDIALVRFSEFNSVGHGISESKRAIAFPNPSNSSVTIEVYSQESDGFTVQIHDMFGRCCYSKSVVDDSFQSGTFRLVVDVYGLGLKSGVYHISVEQNAQCFGSRLIISR